MKRALLSTFAALLAAPAAHAFTADFNGLLQAETRSVADAPGNPGNRVARLPSQLHQAELRAELKQSVSLFDLVARPRLEGNLSSVNGAHESGADAFLQEAFLRANLHESFALELGRIQFGWGPAESVTPTNWLAPEIQWQASPYYEQLGYYRAQGKFTLGQNFSLVVAQELPPLRDRWESRETPAEVFRKRTLAKAEWSRDNANEVVGLVGGSERRATGQLGRAGGYGSLTLNDAWQVYVDGVFREENEGGRWRPFAVAGARYTFEGGAEVHLEGIHNGAGYSPAERTAAMASLSRLSELTLRELLLERGTSLQGKNYAYASFGWPNPAFFPNWVQTPVLHVRALHSLGDHSTSLLAASELGFRDYYTLALYGAYGFGSAGSEMRQLYRGLFGVVGKVSF